MIDKSQDLRVLSKNQPDVTVAQLIWDEIALEVSRLIKAKNELSGYKANT
jgi:hypothetical protein